jgi:hypothetical protein
VLVKAGYAISQPGEDIVVCKDEVVNVCDLINRCKEKTRRESDCETFYGAKKSGNCEEGAKPWVLAIRYEEKPSRGITPLRGSAESPCSSSCSSSSTDCGCGSHEASVSEKKNNAAQKSCKQAPTQCEPSMTCEGYRFEVYKAPPSDPSSKDNGRMYERLMACAAPLMKGLSQFNATTISKLTTEERNKLCGELKETLKEYFQDHQAQYCEIMNCLSRIDCEERDGDMARLIWIWYIALYHCICSSLLPPCPETSGDRRVVLATFTVNDDGCSVSNVCNWTTLRKFVTTMPNLQYWLSFLPVARNLRHGLESICCDTSLTLKKLCEAKERKKGALPRYKASFMRAAKSKLFGGMIMNSMTGKLAAAEPEDVFMGMLGVTAEGGEPYLNAMERENLAQQLLLNQLMMPLLKDMLPDNLAATMSLFGEASRQGAKVAKGVTVAEVKTLKETMESMKATMDQQQEMIIELKNKLGA